MREPRPGEVGPDALVGLAAGFAAAGCACIEALGTGTWREPDGVLAIAALGALAGLSAWLLSARDAALTVCCSALPTLLVGASLLIEQIGLLELSLGGVVFGWIGFCGIGFALGWRNAHG